MEYSEEQSFQEQIMSLITPPVGCDVELATFHAELTGLASTQLTADGFLAVAVRGDVITPQFGRCTANLHHRTDPTTWKADGGVFTLTAEQGGSIRGTYRAACSPTPKLGVRFTGVWRFESGTGVFDELTGGGLTTGTVYTDGHCFIVLDGLLRSLRQSSNQTSPDAI